MEQEKKSRAITYKSNIESLLESFDQLVSKNREERMVQQQLHKPAAIKEDSVKSNNEPQRKLERLADICQKIISAQGRFEVGKAVKRYCKNHSPEDGSLYLLVDSLLAYEKSVSNIRYLFSRMPASFYPHIGYEIVKSSRFTFEQKEKMLSPLCWMHEIDYDKKRILKLFRAYCRKPIQYNIPKLLWSGDDLVEKDKTELNLCLKALLNLSSDAPYIFLLEHKKLRIPKKIINFLVGIDGIDAEKAKRILKRLDFVLQRGASVDTSINNGETSFNYVLMKASYIKNCVDSEKNERNPNQLKLTALFYKSILTLFVEHLDKRKDHLFFIENFENMDLNQKVDYLIEHCYKRSVIDFTP